MCVSCRVYVTQVRRPVLRIVHARAAKISLFIILLWSHGVFFNNILKNTKHNEIQEKARRIQAGMWTEPKLTSNWHCRADTLSLSPTAVASLRVRNPRYRSSSETFFARKISSWTELFVNRGVREPRLHCTGHADTMRSIVSLSWWQSLHLLSVCVQYFRCVVLSL
jgi:hypothetical protein